MSAETERNSAGLAGAGGATAAAAAVTVAEPACLNPFPGLRPFEPGESELFFGREDDIQEILSRLRRTRFLAVVGSSGCGKSSVVRAGLVASVQDGFMAEADAPWAVVMMRPGDNPIAQLAMELNKTGALGTEGGQTDEHVALLQATLRGGSLGIVEAVGEASLPPGTKVLVLVDQFEELFRFARDGRAAGPDAQHPPDGEDAPAPGGGAPRLKAQDEARAFVKLLLAAAASQEVRVYVVLTMRSEFLGQCAAFPGLPEAINAGLYLLPQMSRDQLRDATREPVDACGGSICTRLVNRLLNDLGDDPDQLPILQHAMMRLWALWLPERERGPMDLSHYERVGQLQGSLSKHAEETYLELSEAQRKIAQQLFRLITDTTPDNQKIRRPMRLSEISELTRVEPTDLYPVIEKFREPQRSFLMPPRGEPLSGDTVIDISHESLIRQWGRLREWADLEARENRTYRRLVENARAWKEEGHNKSGLYTGSRLAEAEEWVAEHPGRLGLVEQSFLKASRSAADLRSNITFVLLCAVCVGSILLFVWTRYQRSVAETQSAEAEKQRKVAEEQRSFARRKAKEAEDALSELNAQRTLLRQVFPNLLTAFGGSTQLAGQSDIAVVMEEILAANEALQGVPTTDEDMRRREEIQIRIFIKNKQDEQRVDAKIVENVLREKGFPGLELVPSPQREVPINAIWADLGEVSAQDVKAVAYTLIRAGFQLRYIGPYPGRKLNSLQPIIRVGSDPDVIEGKIGPACRPLTVKEIKEAETFSPLCFRPPGVAPVRAAAGQAAPTGARVGAGIPKARASDAARAASTTPQARAVRPPSPAATRAARRRTP